MDWNKLFLTCLLSRGYGREMYETWYKMSVMIQSGLNIEPHHHPPLPLYGIRKGFEAMESGLSGKVVLSWT